MTQNIQSATNDVACAHPDELVTTIVSAYVSNNSVPKNDLPELIASIRSALSGGAAQQAVEPLQKPTAAEIKKSVTPDALVSFIDGKPYKTLRRHLTANGLSFDQYKAKFGLPKDYPAVAASYSAKRSKLALDLGLGTPRRKPAA
jgi:predicted transcriptional regulator